MCFLNLDDAVCQPLVCIHKIATHQLNAAVQIAPLPHGPPYQLAHAAVLGGQSLGPVSQRQMRPGRSDHFVHGQGFEQDRAGRSTQRRHQLRQGFPTGHAKDSCPLRTQVFDQYIGSQNTIRIQNHKFGRRMILAIETILPRSRATKLNGKVPVECGGGTIKCAGVLGKKKHFRYGAGGLPGSSMVTVVPSPALESIHSLPPLISASR